jgi:5S rRNA maturation endonuclease (ribonuclease M5)
MSTEYSAAESLALLDIAQWCPGYADGKLKGEELWLCSPLRDDRSPDSFSINIHTGLWHDFATKESGNAVQLFSRIRGMTEREAVSFFSLQEDAEPFTPDDPPAKPGFTKRWLYQNQFCSFWIYRYDPANEKKYFLPWAKINGRWIEKKPGKPDHGFPLLNLGRILSSKEKTIVITEGEKDCDAIPREYVGTTWAGGASSFDTADFSHLRGKTVILWPDNDEPGSACMGAIKEKLLALGCNLSMVNVDPSSEIGAGAADLSEEERTAKLKDVTRIQPLRDEFPLTLYGDLGVTKPQWIIKGFLEDKSLGLIFGSSGSGKSYLAIDLAACIVSGKPFCDHQIKKQGPVVYIAGEGFSGISRRLRAWEIKHALSLKECPILISHKPCALGDPELMTHVEQSVERIKEKYGCISLVIIDTWARNMVGDENSTQDTGNAIRSIDELRIKNDCTALIIHHSGQAESDRARGSSALRAALDVEYKVSISDEIVTLTNTKMKDGEPPDPLMFCFDHIDLGVEDEDGEIIFSAALEPLDVNDIVPKNAKLGETQALIYDELYKKVDGMTKADIVHIVESTGKKRNAAYKAMTELSKKGKIKLENGIVLACIPVCIPGIHVSGIQG